MKPNKLTFWLARGLLVAALTAGIHPLQALDIVVANNADSGNGTLRQTIQFNESLGSGNTIVFLNTVTVTITLANALGERSTVCGRQLAT